jgi:hypothetical protein
MDAQYRGNCIEVLKSLIFQVLLYTKEMVKGTLNSALAAEQPDLSDVEIVQGVPHICFLSGLTGEEILMFVRTFPQSGNFFSMLPFLQQP